MIHVGQEKLVFLYVNSFLLADAFRSDVIGLHHAQTAEFPKFRVDFLLKSVSIDKGFSFLVASKFG